MWLAGYFHHHYCGAVCGHNQAPGAPPKWRLLHLDATPVNMSVDADFNAGLIDDDECPCGRAICKGK